MTLFNVLSHSWCPSFSTVLPSFCREKPYNEEKEEENNNGSSMESKAGLLKHVSKYLNYVLTKKIQFLFGKGLYSSFYNPFLYYFLTFVSETTKSDSYFSSTNTQLCTTRYDTSYALFQLQTRYQPQISLFHRIVFEALLSFIPTIQTLVL